MLMRLKVGRRFGFRLSRWLLVVVSKVLCLCLCLCWMMVWLLFSGLLNYTLLGEFVTVFL